MQLPSLQGAKQAPPYPPSPAPPLSISACNCFYLQPECVHTHLLQQEQQVAAHKPIIISVASGRAALLGGVSDVGQEVTAWR